MKKLVVIIVLILLIFVLFMVLAQKENIEKIKEVCFENKCFEVEIAKDKALGLMNREVLDGGMLFVYNQERFISIWMKNMKIPIDIIWLNKDKEVVHLVENAQPCITEKCESFKSNKKAQYILEVNAGQIQENNVQLGNQVEFK